jgi:succinate dehydrogenase / fumarate reductase, cytochrome b subunit
MAMSIAHRVTGAALYFGTLLLAVYLVAILCGKTSYDQVQALFSSIPGRLMLFGYTWALMHHMLGGIRHFIWDVGAGYSAGVRKGLAVAGLVGSITLTVLIWALAYSMR